MTHFFRLMATGRCGCPALGGSGQGSGTTPREHVLSCFQHCEAYGGAKHAQPSTFPLFQREFGPAEGRLSGSRVLAQLGAVVCPGLARPPPTQQGHRARGPVRCAEGNSGMRRIPALPLPACVILDKLLSHSEPQFPHL